MLIHEFTPAEGFVVRGGNTSLMSTADKPFVNKRRELPMYCVLIEHPHEGLILWETVRKLIFAAQGGRTS